MELASPLPSSGPLPTSQGVGRPLRLIVALSLAALLLGAAYVIRYAPYTAGDAIGYNLGLVGGILMLLLLPYSLRKRLRILQGSGAMKAWFLFHIWAGLFGPLLVVFHSTFTIGSFNGGVVLGSTFLVTASGTVGRFFYRKIYRGLSGSRASLEEMQAGLAREMAALSLLQQALPAVDAEIARYLALVGTPPAGRWRRAAHFLALGGRRRLAGRRLRRALAADGRGEAAGGLLAHIDATLLAAQRSAQFTTYERLFARWHVIHIPFLYLLVLTAVVHVVAVHAY